MIYDADVPVAGGFAWHPSADDDELIRVEHEGAEAGFEAGSYLQLDNTVVIPSHRGNGLQAVLVEALLQGVDETAVATVSPKNPASYKTLVKCGFEVRELVNRHGEYQRYIMVRPATVCPA